MFTRKYHVLLFVGYPGADTLKSISRPYQNTMLASGGAWCCRAAVLSPHIDWLLIQTLQTRRQAPMQNETESSKVAGGEPCRKHVKIQSTRPRTHHSCTPTRRTLNPCSFPNNKNDNNKQRHNTYIALRVTMQNR